MYSKVEISEKNTTRQVPNVKRIICSVSKEKNVRKSNVYSTLMPVKALQRDATSYGCFEIQTTFQRQHMQTEIIPHQSSKLISSL